MDTIEKMSKKELKQYINQNGFFIHISEIEKLDENFLDTNAIEAPKGENILKFRGIASQSFAKGEVSRNGYKIDQSGWMVENYLKNPQILLSHNANEPIGKALSVKSTNAGLEIVFYVNLDWVKEEADKNRLRDGAFSTLSTGHITLEYKFENAETGEILTEEEAEEKYGVDKWTLLWGDSWNFIVTKAELVEVSFVSTPSNPDALVTRNAIDEFKNAICPKEKEVMEEKKNVLEKNEIKGSETPPNPLAEISENGIDAEKKEVKTEDDFLKEKNATEIMWQNSFDELKNSFSTLEKNFNELKEENKMLKESNTSILNLVKIVGQNFIDQSAKVDALKNKIESVPVLKGVRFKNEASSTTGLGAMIKSL